MPLHGIAHQIARSKLAMSLAQSKSLIDPASIVRLLMSRMSAGWKEGLCTLASREGTYTCSTSDQETFFFKTLETTHFIPTTEYLQKCVEAETLQRYLEITSYRKPVYIITGVKVVTGAEVNTSKSGTIGGDITVEVDGTVWTGGSVPIGGGSGIEGKTAKSQGTKWEGSGDFVFAFRVSKVVVKKSGEVNEEEYRKGAILNSGREVKQADFTL
ncbi:uncharacterized protein B0J16DRAFT_331335 [Fusarium flagelliforme]|uniref:uncharacterized protein n=1 Tax=Fusarium flagelliforme TaxID=2675880 RepID=UPI001E8D3B4A|nr:uncharacterized protein B0J16DRAFT_331335 [Fusarium flagelliforme]KAH7198905.1 hypothetical protein B0J16DRAFT_331335 [Fusarium flagelliforme]